MTGQALWEAYLARRAVLDVLRPYAQSVLLATSHPDKTPVEPLATMGGDGGPLLCDVCKKPMRLEGGGFQNVNADVAWQRSPKKGWVSYISGGMVVRIETNGTLRIYHGYPGRSGCIQTADRVSRKSPHSREEVSALLDELSRYLRAEGLSDDDNVLNDVFRTMLTYDPGLGVNQPPLAKKALKQA